MASTRGCSTSETFQCHSSTSLCRPPCRAARLTSMKRSRNGPRKSRESDGFIFVTPEYNYGPAAVLKNAFDWVYPESNRKAAAFVSYGSVAGARSVQQLRLTAIELQLAPIRSSVHIPVATLWAHFQGGDVEAGLAELEAPREGDDRRAAVVDSGAQHSARDRVLSDMAAMK